jgi:two-component sensor histidine kinase
MNILVAEDDPTSAVILESLLSRCGHRVMVVRDGQDAIDVMTGKNPPRLMILDWIMPGPQGDEVCASIRAREGDPPAYIIMLTVKADRGSVVKGLESGANDYMHKPYNEAELIARINAANRTLEMEERYAKQVTLITSKEKEIESLLYEVHHRVKNNMNTIMNLLTIQANSSKSKEVSDELLNAVGRMKSMGVLYDKLYRSENLKAMSICTYLTDLVQDIVQAFPDHAGIAVSLDIDNFELDAQRLMAIGMIVNELAYNSLKYAFVGRAGGTIAIQAHRSEDRATILVSDDGVGIPENVSLADGKNFGLTLVQGLAAQAGGNVTLLPGPGTRFMFEFGMKSAGI